MAILAECPFCHNKQSTSNKQCCSCGADLDKLKGASKVRYWINYRLNGKQHRKMIGSFEDCNPYSIEDARTVQAQWTVKKKENRTEIFEPKPGSKMTFNELTKWYLELRKVDPKLSAFWLLELTLKKFNSEFGNQIVNDITQADLKRYQGKRKKEGKADNTVDSEIGAAKTMINTAFVNNKVSGDPIRAFKAVKDLLKRGANERDRILSQDEYDNLLDNAPKHLQWILATAYHTGMREGEILNLTRDKLDLKNRLVKLDPEDTKTRMPRVIPICDELYEILSAIPRAIHDPHVFLYKGKPIRDIRTGLKAACKEAKIVYGRFKKDGFIFHDLRHTFDTRLRRAGVDEIDRMALTGHESREMDRRYNTVDIEDRWRAINKLSPKC